MQEQAFRAFGWVRRAVLALGLLGAALAAPACTSDLSEDLSGKSCSATGDCLSGYECEKRTGRCVPIGPADNSAGGEGGGGSTTPVACGEGQTVCGGDCVVLNDDANNCRSCGTT